MTTNTKIKLRPLADRILVKRKENEEKNIGGIILPDSAQSKQDVGIVKAIGPGKRDKDGNFIEMSVAENDHIMWDKYGGQEVTIDGETFIILKLDDVIAIVD
ncbi:MAG: 10 kDa chaperonin [Chlamydiia bacterium]|nr:10 kDa chaperonin [Chlamydiia bacterium]